MALQKSNFCSCCVQLGSLRQQVAPRFDESHPWQFTYEKMAWMWVAPFPSASWVAKTGILLNKKTCDFFWICYYLFAGQRCKWLQFLFDAFRCSATKGHGLTPHRETDISGNPRGCLGPLRDLSLSLAIRSCGGLCTPQLGMEISSFDRFLSATFCCITYRFVHLCPYLSHSISSWLVLQLFFFQVTIYDKAGPSVGFAVSKQQAIDELEAWGKYVFIVTLSTTLALMNHWCFDSPFSIGFKAYCYIGFNWRCLGSLGKKSENSALLWALLAILIYIPQLEVP